MEKIFLEITKTQGLWGALAVILVFYILKGQNKRDEIQDAREKNYQSIIEELTNKLFLIIELKDDIKELKYNVSKINSK